MAAVATARGPAGKAADIPEAFAAVATAAEEPAGHIAAAPVGHIAEVAAVAANTVAAPAGRIRAAGPGSAVRPEAEPARHTEAAAAAGNTVRATAVLPLQARVARKTGIPSSMAALHVHNVGRPN